MAAPSLSEGLLENSFELQIVAAWDVILVQPRKPSLNVGSSDANPVLRFQNFREREPEQATLSCETGRMAAWIFSGRFLQKVR